MGLFDIIGTKDGGAPSAIGGSGYWSYGSYVGTSGQVQNGGVARGVSHDGQQDTGTRALSSGLPLNSDPDGVVGPIGSKIVANDGTGAATTDRHGVAKALSGGTLAFTPTTTGTRSEEWVIRGVTTKLSGAAMKTEAGPALNGDFNNGTVKDGIHGVIGSVTLGSGVSREVNKLARPSTNINPSRTIGGNAGAAFTFVNPADASDAVASEIFPTRAVPGELTYHFGGLGKPTTDEYKAKDSNE